MLSPINSVKIKNSDRYGNVLAFISKKLQSNFFNVIIIGKENSSELWYVVLKNMFIDNYNQQCYYLLLDGNSLGERFRRKISMIFDSLVEVLASKYGFERSEITMESGLRELGLDSLDVIDILVELEEQIGKEIELEQKVETVGELVQYIEKKCQEDE